MKAKGVNWRNWRRLLEFLKTRKPSEVNMAFPLDWPQWDKKITLKKLREKHCGTVGCIAGWGGVLFSKKIDCLRETHVRGITQHALNLNDTQMRHLYRGEWGAFRGPDKRDVIKYMTKALKNHDVMVRLED